ncbi:MAG: UDP-N-acetylmuramoyl-tripeptide--D-alanyl-D-alanine ligase [Phycisphaerae bacterium]|nr:UDP-N-acetylmuramoyl-tripeptide--D-alanyl-D-alanine ligase [Phycisphaerae bacterium]
MRALTGNEIRQGVRGRWLSKNSPLPVHGVAIDSRTAGQDDLFVAIKGDKFDGHDYLEAAAAAGCIAAVIEYAKQPSDEIMQLFSAGVFGVEDSRTALMDLAGYYRSIIPATIVGVTGSNGKTTVKRMVEHILKTRLTGTCSPKSFNNDIGVPLTLLSAGAGDDYVICEVGSNAPGEIAALARAVKPNIAIITSINPSHLDGFGSIENIAIEKAALLGWLGDRDIAITTADSFVLEMALKSYSNRTITFGESPTAQLRVTNYESDGKSQRFQINDRSWVSLGVPGKHNASNAMAAIAAAARFGFQQEEAIAAIADFTGVEMRLQESVVGDNITIINDAYNANPASMTAAAAVLSEHSANRRVFIAGDMFELGTESEKLHEQVGKTVGAMSIDLVVGVGALGKIIATAAKQCGKKTATFTTVQDAENEIANLLEPGDVVLLKGSRGMGMEKLLNAWDEGKKQ